ncbi:MAG: hypothetical protein NTV01_17190 [Bacteroidia bacterium]|nr:hypothetical protein [Bacteroidia bacterium]
MFAQTETEYEEISVFLMVQRVGGIEIPAVYHNQQIYLPVQDIFDFLRIKNTPSPAYDSVAGYFVSQEAAYVVDKLHSRIVYANKVFELKSDDLIRTEANLFLRSNFFGEVFGLDCSFNFRSLSVNLNTKIELPVIRDMRLEFMRSNITRMKGEVKADTMIPRSNPLFRFGAADWSVMANQEIGGDSETRLNLGLGARIAGGEANVSLQYYANQPFAEKQQQYLWRLVNNDRKALRQILAGKIASQATSSIFNPVVGIQLTNAPTTYRRSYGTYTLSDYTEPDWAVELYVNSVLVDYVKADASGFFTFEVPLMYGSTIVLLRFYGPFGEEQSRQQSISVPYNFLPAKEFQYTMSAGMVEDSLNSLFSRANANYGLGRFMTIGGGMEYLSSVTSGSIMPFVNTSMRLGSNLLFSGEYTYGVRGKGILNYRTVRNLQFELNYTRYDRNQTAINFNYLEERKAMVSFPIRGSKFSAYSRITFSQNILPATKYSTAEWLLSGVLFGVSTNFTTYAMFPELTTPYIYSNLSLGLRLPGKFIFRPQAQFEYTGNQLMLLKGELEKQFLKHGFLNLSYEYNYKSRLQNIQVGFRYDFSLAQTVFTYRKSNDISTLVESARGSFLVDRKTKYAGATNRSSIGKGGIVLMPFLDMNGNGRYDKGESKVLGLRININGGRVEQNKRDSVIRIFDLEPYMSYFIELDRFSFENISWQMRLKNVSVMVDPNQFKLVEIPISVMGEAAGMVNLSSAGGDQGQGRIIVGFYKSNGAFFAKTLTEPDGYFSFLGLPPGSYIARVDTAQLRKLNMTAIPDTLPFTMERTKDGDVKDGLQFFIRSNKTEDGRKKTEDVKRTEDERRKTEKKQKDTVAIEQPKKEAEVALKKDTLAIEQPKKAKAVIEQPKKQDSIAPAKPSEPIVSKKSITVYAVQVAASKTYLAGKCRNGSIGHQWIRY